MCWIEALTRAPPHTHTHTHHQTGTHAPAPGLITPAPGRKHAQLQTAARQVEAMVLQKLAQREVRACVSTWS